MGKSEPSSLSAFRRKERRKEGKRKYRELKLKAGDKKKLKELMSRGRESVRVLKRAQILGNVDKGETMKEVADVIGVNLNTVWNIKSRYLEGGLQRALWDAPRPGKAPALNPKQKQQVVAMVCGPCPEGQARWTVRLLTEEVIRRKIVPTISREPIRVCLKSHHLKPWREKNVVRS